MTGNKPRHAPTPQFPVVDDVLQVGGIALTRLAAARRPHPVLCL
jgi:diaminopimelate decarboxylase